MTRLLALISLISLFLLSPLPAQAADGQPPRVAVLPFELIAPEDMSYLVEGVRTMLGSRLAAGQSARLLERSLVEQELAAAGRPQEAADFFRLGEKLAADYLVGGVMTAVGSGLSLDVAVYDLQDPAATRSFFATAAYPDDVIPTVDRLAREIRGEVLVAAPSAPAAPAPEARTGEQQPTYVSPHPERQLYDRWSTGTSAFIRSSDISWLRGYSKSHDIPLSLRAMDAADVTGDGQTEIILAGPNVVEIYRRDMGRFGRIAQIRTLNRYPIHYLSTADLNGNGRAEIYVSAADHRGANSLILEWNGSELVRTHDNLPWYIRAVRLPMQGTTLVGQRSGPGSFVLPGLQRLHALADGSLEQAGAVSVPGRLNLFDFVYADLDEDGSEEIITISQSDRLEVLSAGGGRLWRSEGRFGGTTRLLGGPDPATGEEAGLQHEVRHLYVPSRIVVRDINQNGRPDIVVVKNIDAFARFFGHLRSYSAGEIHALSWDGAGMNEIWRTRRIDGYIADIQLGPDLSVAGEDGQTQSGAELFAGVVLGSDGLSIQATAESSIFVYPLEYRAPGPDSR